MIYAMPEVQRKDVHGIDPWKGQDGYDKALDKCYSRISWTSYQLISHLVGHAKTVHLLYMHVRPSSLVSRLGSGTD